eukprot:6999816-Alexandrium_andersonii.AAC.1
MVIPKANASPAKAPPVQPKASMPASPVGTTGGTKAPPPGFTYTRPPCPDPPAKASQASSSMQQ